MIHECNGVDHRLESYAARDRRLLALVESFNRRLVASLQQGADLSKVLAALDPDPARYTWVDEGGGLVEAVLEEAESELAAAPRLPGFRSLTSSVLPRHAARRPPGARHCARRIGPRGLDRMGASMPASEWSACPSTRPAAPPASRVRSPVRWATASGPAWPSTATAPAGSSSVSGATTRSASGAAGCQAQWLQRGRARQHDAAPVLQPGGGPPRRRQPGVLLAGISRRAVRNIRKTPAQRRLRRDAADQFGVRSQRLGPGDRGRRQGHRAHAWTTYGEQGYQTSLLVRRKGEAPHRQTLRRPRLVLAPSEPRLRPGRLALVRVRRRGARRSRRDRDPRGFVRGSEMELPRRTGTRPDGRAVPGDLAPDVRPRSSWCASPAPKAMPRAREPSAQARSSRRPACRASPRPRTDRSPSPTGA